MDIVQWIITGLSIIAVIYSNYVKMRWSKEFTENKNSEIAAIERELASVSKSYEERLNTKDERIRVLKDQVDHLRTLTPDLVIKYLEAGKKQTEKLNMELAKEITDLKNGLQEVMINSGLKPMKRSQLRTRRQLSDT